jgi:hypothetical protein
VQFLPAAQGPIVLEVGDEKIAVPRFEMRDFVEWAAELDAEKQKRFDATAAEIKDDDKRFQLRNTFSVIPADLTACLNLVFTPAGIQRVCDKCFARAKIISRGGQTVDEPLPADTANGIIAANPSDIPKLARQLVGIKDLPRPAATDEKKDEKTDPLPPSGQAS